MNQDHLVVVLVVNHQEVEVVLIVQVVDLVQEAKVVQEAKAVQEDHKVAQEDQIAVVIDHAVAHIALVVVHIVLAVVHIALVVAHIVLVVDLNILEKAVLHNQEKVVAVVEVEVIIQHQNHRHLTQQNLNQNHEVLHVNLKKLVHENDELFPIRIVMIKFHRKRKINYMTRIVMRMKSDNKIQVAMQKMQVNFLVMPTI